VNGKRYQTTSAPYLTRRFSGVRLIFWEDRMTKKATTTPRSPDPELYPTVGETPDEALAILWKIARDPEQSGTARVAAIRLLLMDARERGDGAEGTRPDSDLDKRALALLRRAAN
jgi:hypothetical protein